jgi:hypothetical protein
MVGLLRLPSFFYEHWWGEHVLLLAFEKIFFGLAIGVFYHHYAGNLALVCKEPQKEIVE